MQKDPTVAIVIATYNGEQFLAEQLESIFAQTYKNFKIYVSDDASSDATPKMLASYKEKYPDIFFYTSNRSNKGFVKNFESLLMNVEAPYIALCDQDDIWFPEKLAVQLEEMIKLEKAYPELPCLVHSDLSMIDEHGRQVHSSYFKYRGYRLKQKRDLGHILGPCGVMGNTLLINHRAKELALPFPQRLDFHDYWIAVQCELFGKRKTLDIPLVQYRIHNTNTSNTQKQLKRKKQMMWRRDFRLPNIETNRKYYLPKLLAKISEPEDIKVVEAYLDYLNFRKNRLYMYGNLIRYALVKRGFFLRVKVFFKMMLTNRYQ